ncbi:MAG: DUF721 domain-containing protein [Chlamydiae bacterium]|nr:DUF721 domain-containing protein [Chlamydiota bacterium]
MARYTPRNYDGTRPSGVKIDDLLPELLKEVQKKTSDSREMIFQEWAFLLGEKFAHLTEPLSFLDGVLTVKVKSQTLYSLLCQHEKPLLLRKLKGKFQIKDLVFKIG